MGQRTWSSFGIWAAIVLALWIIACIIAEAIPVFNDLLSLISALFASWFTYGLSGVFWLYLNRGRYGESKRKMFLTGVNVGCFVIGLVIVRTLPPRSLSLPLSPIRSTSLINDPPSAPSASTAPAPQSTKTPPAQTAASPAPTTLSKPHPLVLFQPLPRTDSNSNPATVRKRVYIGNLHKLFLARLLLFVYYLHSGFEILVGLGFSFGDGIVDWWGPWINWILSTNRLVEYEDGCTASLIDHLITYTILYYVLLFPSPPSTFTLSSLYRK